jgi:flagellar protein FliL
MPGFGNRKSLIQWLGAIVGLTLIAAVVGAGLGIVLVGQVKAYEQEQARLAPANAAPAYGQNVSLIDLPPIISNLAEPPNAWVRLQVAIVYDNKAVSKPQVLAATISEDILAYMKTVTVAQIGGASGLEHLREDLNERALTRSDGHIHEVIIQTLVVQ